MVTVWGAFIEKLALLDRFHLSLRSHFEVEEATEDDPFDTTMNGDQLDCMTAHDGPE